MFLYHFHSLTATVPNGLTAVSAHNIRCGFVDIRLIAHCNTGLKTPSHAQCSNLQLIFWVFPNYSSSHLQPGALTCIESMFLYHFHSATGLALSLHTASDVDLCKGCNTDQCTPSQAGCSNSRSIRFYFLPKYSSSHLQPGALTCIESHDCVSFPQLDCRSANRLTAVSARNI